MEDYQKRMIEEFKELNERTMRLEYFLDAPETSKQRNALDPEMVTAMRLQYSGMCVYRTNLAKRLELLGLAEHAWEFPELVVGDVFKKEDGKEYKCIGHEANGCPVCEVLSKNTMTFGEAIEALKRGFKVARKGWNGKGMFLWLKPATDVKAEWCKDPLLKSLAEENGGSIPALGTVCMYTHDSTGRNAILTGWLASQSDMLLEDWIIVD